jgi:hypothetical protein
VPPRERTHSFIYITSVFTNKYRKNEDVRAFSRVYLSFFFFLIVHAHISLVTVAIILLSFPCFRTTSLNTVKLKIYTYKGKSQKCNNHHEVWKERSSS